MVVFLDLLNLVKTFLLNTLKQSGFVKIVIKNNIRR
jgi:hypothetical protein